MVNLKVIDVSERQCPNTVEQPGVVQGEGDGDAGL